MTSRIYLFVFLLSMVFDTTLIKAIVLVLDANINGSSKGIDTMFIPTTVTANITTVISLLPNVIASTSSNFIGITLDYGDASALTLNLSTPQLNLLTKALAPGILRIGGAAQDSIAYEASTGTCPPPSSSPTRLLSISPTQNHLQALSSSSSSSPQDYHCSQMKEVVWDCLKNSRWGQLSDFALSNNLKLVFGLNGCLGRPTRDGPLDFGMLDGFLNMVAARSTPPPWAFEIGNELDGSYSGSDGVHPEAMAKDLITLSQKLANLWPSNTTRPKILAPDIAVFTGNTKLPDYFERVLKNIPNPKDILTGVTYHQYVYCAYPDTNRSTILSLSCLDKLRISATNLTAIAAAHGLKAWVGESSNVWTGGLPNISNVFLDSFYYALQLSVMSSNGVPVVIRQDLIGGNYDLIDHHTLTPNPSYWIAFIWRKLVGKIVLDFKSTPSLPYAVHVSVHCAAQKGATITVLINFSIDHTYTIGFDTITIYEKNIYTDKLTNNSKKNIRINNYEVNDDDVRREDKIAQLQDAKEAIILSVYQLTGPVHSRQIQLNGNILEVKGNTMPELKPMQVKNAPVNLPPASITFVQIPDTTTLC